jgi:hypothetical protein
LPIVTQYGTKILKYKVIPSSIWFTPNFNDFGELKRKLLTKGLEYAIYRVSERRYGVHMSDKIIKKLLPPIPFDFPKTNLSKEEDNLIKQDFGYSHPNETPGTITKSLK